MQQTEEDMNEDLDDDYDKGLSEYNEKHVNPFFEISVEIKLQRDVRGGP